MIAIIVNGLWTYIKHSKRFLYLMQAIKKGINIKWLGGDGPV